MPTCARARAVSSGRLGWVRRREREVDQNGAVGRIRIDVLLVHDHRDDTRSAWFGPERVHVASQPAELRALGVDEPREGRLVDVAIRAALGTGAGVRVIPEHGPVTEGIGGLLRWR